MSFTRTENMVANTVSPFDQYGVTVHLVVKAQDVPDAQAWVSGFLNQWFLHDSRTNPDGSFQFGSLLGFSFEGGGQ